MNISREEFLERYCIHLKNRIVYPYFKYESFDEETMSYTDLVIIKTAEEMREEEDKIDICEPTDHERIERLEEIVDDVIFEVIPTIEEEIMQQYLKPILTSSIKMKWIPF